MMTMFQTALIVMWFWLTILPLGSLETDAGLGKPVEKHYVYMLYAGQAAAVVLMLLLAAGGGLAESDY